MENWGLIKYRETKLLLKEGETSSSSKESIAKLVAHEVGHQVRLAFTIFVFMLALSPRVKFAKRTDILLGEKETTV